MLDTNVLLSALVFGSAKMASLLAPAPVTLWIRLEKDGVLRFEQAEHTQEDLAGCEQVWA